VPLVRIDLPATRTADSVRAIADAIHDSIVEAYGIPVGDRFQIITRKADDEVIAHNAGLGFARVDPVMIQIFTQEGRSAEAKQDLYRMLSRNLASVGVASQDSFVSYIENTSADWSFGFGRAQYITGELATPSAS
jgi:phenylpyruvate tautomerase PptA (4-oxalocrotonate tautomerase family)